MFLGISYVVQPQEILMIVIKSVAALGAILLAQQIMGTFESSAEAPTRAEACDRAEAEGRRILARQDRTLDQVGECRCEPRDRADPGSTWVCDLALHYRQRGAGIGVRG
jgi:hypothetical protein